MKQTLLFLTTLIFLSVESDSAFALQKENDGQTLTGKVKATIPACQDKKDYEQIFKLMFVEKDYDAASEMTEFGKCILIGKNEKVTVQDVGLENIKVRKKGSSKTYWTSRTFIE